MNRRVVSIEELLRWRLDQAAADVPPPRGAELLARALPWWEISPERFRALTRRLARMPVAYGYARAPGSAQPGGYPVPALITHADDVETYARVLYFVVVGNRLRLRFMLDGASDALAGTLETTFVSDADDSPLFASTALRVARGEYRLEMELPEHIVHGWSRLRVTDRMPFRFVLRPSVTPSP